MIWGYRDEMYWGELRVSDFGVRVQGFWEPNSLV